jgi:hypothetical protein
MNINTYAFIHFRMTQSLVLWLLLRLFYQELVITISYGTIARFRVLPGIIQIEKIMPTVRLILAKNNNLFGRSDGFSFIRWNPGSH